MPKMNSYELREQVQKESDNYSGKKESTKKIRRK